jgi:hypothetical protein
MIMKEGIMRRKWRLQPARERWQKAFAACHDRRGTFRVCDDITARLLPEDE